MITRLSILSLTALAAVSGFAQKVQDDPQLDPILEAIQEFNNRDREAANEISVVLDPDETPFPDAKVVEDEAAEPG